jgi:hypothetical protein
MQANFMANIQEEHTVHFYHSTVTTYSHKLLKAFAQNLKFLNIHIKNSKSFQGPLV